MPGTAVMDVATAATNFMNGLQYRAEKNKFDPDFG